MPENDERSLFDRLSDDGQRTDRIIGHLLRDVLFRMPYTPTDSPYPNLVDMLADIAGKWIGYKIGHWSIGEEKLDFVSQHGRGLYEILTNCIERKPAITENHYRAGMLACFLGQEDDAIQLFKDASQYEETSSAGSAYAQILTDVDMTIFDLRGPYIGPEEAIRLSKLAAHVARAINVLGPGVGQGIKDDLEREAHYPLSPAGVNDGDNEAVFRVIQSLLNGADSVDSSAT